LRPVTASRAAITRRLPQPSRTSGSRLAGAAKAATARRRSAPLLRNDREPAATWLLQAAIVVTMAGMLTFFHAPLALAARAVFHG
jgi:hypothetical protein